MAVVNLPELLQLLSPAELTVRAQALPPNDQDKLLWDQFFPRQDTPSVDLWDVSTLDWRPVADRREWNARGRLIPPQVPARRKVSIVPIEARDKIDEKEQQTLAEMGGDKVLEIVGASIPKRVERLVDSVYRRLDVDAMQAWSLGTITQRNPEDASKTFTASFGFPATRYTTAATAWNDAGVNAYTLLLAWITAAEDLVGSIKGIICRLATLNAILADAPNQENSVTMTRTNLADRISQDSGEAFDFFPVETSRDIFTDGGTATTRVKAWPTHIIAAIPSDGVIGKTYFAPVMRAMDVDNQISESGGVDVRGVAVYHQESGMGRDIDIEAQLNALPVPDESRLYVTDVGV